MTDVHKSKGNSSSQRRTEIKSCSLLFLLVGKFFSECSISYLTKSVGAIHSLMRYVFILERRLQPCIVYLQCIWQIFLFKCIVISHLPSFKGVPLLFQETICSDLVISRVLCLFETSNWSHLFFKGIELIHNSSRNHPFNEWPIFYIKEQL